MSEHDIHLFKAKLTWTGASKGPVRDYASYSRDFRAELEGKPSLELSGAPEFRGDAARHNPEDLLVASLSACHALTFLALCAKFKIEVVAYEDDAEGEMKKIDGVVRFAEVRLKPRVTLAPGADQAKAQGLHEQAHKHCFIAQSVNFPVLHSATTSVTA